MATRFSAAGQAYTTTMTLGTLANYSFSLWGKITVNRAADSTFCSLYLDGGNFGLFMARLGLTASFVDEFVAFDLSALTVGTWYHLGCSVTANTGLITLRAEGSSTTASTSWTAAAGFTSDVVGTTFAVGTDPFANWVNGCVTGVKVWTAALTAAELDRESRQLLPVRWANIAGVYPLTVPETTDYSGLGRTLTGGVGATAEAGPAVPRNATGAIRGGLSAAASRASNW